jgi:hypothetical protein
MQTSATRNQKMPASNLECRLLSASGCAYGIDLSGGFTPQEPYFSAVGFQATPTAIVGGPDNINACLVGKNGDGVIVAFRGTLVPNINDLASLLDWMQDFDAVPKGVDGMPGKVHTGFWRGLETIWEGVMAAVQPLLTAPSGKLPLYVTGHSKGGGLAQLAAIRFHLAGMSPQRVCTFASPRVGDQAFADEYDAAITGIRYEYTDDIVPHLPLSQSVLNSLLHLPVIGRRFAEFPVWDYVDAGTLSFINWDMQIVGDSEMLRAQRFAHLTLLLVQGKVQQIAADHDHSCGAGYMSQVCPGVCP